jgi:hypothetical protein
MGGSAECDATDQNEKTKSKTANDTSTRFIITPFAASRLLLWFQKTPFAEKPPQSSYAFMTKPISSSALSI